MEADGFFKANYSTIRKLEQFQFINYNNYKRMRVSPLLSQ